MQMNTLESPLTDQKPNRAQLRVAQMGNRLGNPDTQSGHQAGEGLKFGAIVAEIASTGAPAVAGVETLALPKDAAIETTQPDQANAEPVDTDGDETPPTDADIAVNAEDFLPDQEGKPDTRQLEEATDEKTADNADLAQINNHSTPAGRKTILPGDADMVGKQGREDVPIQTDRTDRIGHEVKFLTDMQNQGIEPAFVARNPRSDISAKPYFEDAAQYILPHPKPKPAAAEIEPIKPEHQNTGAQNVSGRTEAFPQHEPAGTSKTAQNQSVAPSFPLLTSGPRLNDHGAMLPGAQAAQIEIEPLTESFGREGPRGPVSATESARHAQFPLHARPEMPRFIAAQITESVRMAPGEQRIEVILEPKELGRVKVAISGTDAAMTISVLAERSDTLELLKRHAAILASEFRDIGYQNPAFSFGQEARGEQRPDQDHQAGGRDQAALSADDQLTTQLVRVTQLTASDRVDIRL